MPLIWRPPRFRVPLRLSCRHRAWKSPAIRCGGGAVVLSNAVDGDEDLGTFTLVTSDSFTEDMEADIVVHSVSLGPSSGVRDYLDTELLSRSMHLNRPDPVLVATAPLVGNALTSGADVGAVDDDSPGVISYSVNFTNLWGDPGEGQAHQVGRV